jgi:hypothetical protein
MAKNGKFYELLALEIAAGSSVKDAATKAGCSLTHAYHISADPSFRVHVGEIRSEAVSASVGKLSNAACLAVDVLVEILSSPNDKDRLPAAKALLSALGPISELGELRKRIDALESKQCQT